MKSILVCIIIMTAGTQAADLEKLLDSLRAEIRTYQKASAGDKGTEHSPSYRSESMLPQLPAGDSFKEEMLAQTLQIVEQIRAATLSDKINEVSGELSRELQNRMAQKQRALKDKYETTLRSALAVGLKATTVKELDAPLQQLARLQKEIYAVNYRGDLQTAINAEAIGAVEQILTTIQDAMISVANPTGNRRRDSAERMQSAASSYSRQLSDLIPRSEFFEQMQAVAARLFPAGQTKALTREEFEKQVHDEIAGVKKLDDMGPALAKIEALSGQQRELNGYYGDSGLTGQLRSYRQTYEDLRAGAATSLSFASTSYSSQGSEVLTPLKNLLVKFGISRALGTPQGLAPKDEESIATYLQRILDVARQNSDWLLMTRVLDAAQSMNISTVASTLDTTALRQFLAGVNQERARQFSGAVASYLAALKTGSQILPVNKISEMLDALKRTIPRNTMLECNSRTRCLPVWTRDIRVTLAR